VLFSRDEIEWLRFTSHHHIIMQVSIGKRTLELASPPEKTTVLQLKLAYAKLENLSVHRITFKKDGNRLDDDSKTLDWYEISAKDSIEFKDLGPQIGYRTVFVVEYLGPILFMLFYAMRPTFLYGPKESQPPYTRAALVGIVCWVCAFSLVLNSLNPH
jgi:very-long-chain enoyl-CoA reductase